MKTCPETLKACADLSEKARFLNAFVHTQKSRQQVKAGKSAWLEDERTLREQERSLDDSVQRLFETLASSWLPSAEAAEYRKNLEEAHTNQVHQRMDRQRTVRQAKTSQLEPRQAASLARQELQLAADLAQEANVIEHDIKFTLRHLSRRMHHRATEDHGNLPGWWKVLDLRHRVGGDDTSQNATPQCPDRAPMRTAGDHVVTTVLDVFCTDASSDDHQLQQAEHVAHAIAMEADSNEIHQQWHQAAATEAMELCNKHKFARADAHACVHDSLQALHENFYKAARKALEGLAQERLDIPATWNQQDELAFLAAMVQVVNSIKRAATRGEILDAVQHRMPGKTPCEIRHMDRKVWQDYTCRTKRRELAQMWIRQHTAVVDECQQLLSESEVASMQHMLHCAEVVETEVAKERAQLQHEQHCQAHEQFTLEKEVVEASERAKEAAAARARQEAMIQKQEVSKIKVQLYRQRLASNATAERQTAVERLKLAELRSQPHRLQNAIRVRFRDGLACKKKADMKMQLQVQKDEEQARESRLKRIRAMVKVNVLPDKDRPLKPTKCMLAEAYQQHSVFAEAHGYSAEVVTSDRRYRAMNMMRSKGLLGKAYAQDTLRQLYNSATPRRLDCLTSDQLLGSYVAPRMV